MSIDVAADEAKLVTPRELATRTLLAAPQRAPWFTTRRRLIDILQAGQHLPLVLISASAGTGKTALVADWLATGTGTEGVGTGWVTLDASRDQLWPLVLSSLQGLGVEVPRASDDGSHRLDPAALTTLAATLAALPRPVRIVIDGYEAAPTHTAEDLDFLLRCAAGGLRLVIVTRVDPALRLYRHRLEGSVLEVRDRDLAFDDHEAGVLLERAGLTLSPRSVHDLNARVRGWATGLRFAARALASAPDPDRAVVDVVATITDINEYLLGEVLDAQPPEVRQLLLATSVPDTLFPGLVEELAGAGRSRANLTRLNAFLEPVVGAPGCYRYYPFFRDLLRAELAYESPDLLVELHRRAGDWHVRHGLLEAGVGHLVAAGSWSAAAAAVVEGLALERLLLCREDDPIVSMFTSMPERFSSLACLLVQSGLALGRGRLAECGALLAAAREVTAEEQSPRSTASAALLDAVRARDCESPQDAERLARRSQVMLDQLGEPALTEHPELVVLASNCRGVAEIRAGRLREAARTLGGCAAAAPTRSPARFQALGYLALVEALDGELSQAADNAALALDEDVVRPVRGVLKSSASEVALAVISLERLDLDAADNHLRTAAADGDSSPVCRGLAAIAEAGVEGSKGRVDRALQVIADARAALPEDDEWLGRRLALEAARHEVAAGSSARALDDLTRVEHEPEADVLAAQAHLREGHHGAVATCLDRVRDTEIPLQARIASILVEAARESRQRSLARTRGLLNESLRLAAPERIRRPFREAPPDIQEMLSSDPQLAALGSWLPRPAHPFGPAPTTGRRVETPAMVPPEPDDLPAVIEPLTAKELEVLGHLAELLSTQEIAAVMFISVNTVRTHVRNILRKLGVTRRSAAVRRARRLQIV